MSQNKTVLKHLRSNHITSIEAIQLYGITRLAARISDLRNDGYFIDTVLITKGKSTFARYFLKEWVDV